MVPAELPARAARDGDAGGPRRLLPCGADAGPGEPGIRPARPALSGRAQRALCLRRVPARRGPRPGDRGVQAGAEVSPEHRGRCCRLPSSTSIDRTGKRPGRGRSRPWTWLRTILPRAARWDRCCFETGRHRGAIEQLERASSWRPTVHRCGSCSPVPTRRPAAGGRRTRAGRVPRLQLATGPAARRAGHRRDSIRRTRNRRTRVSWAQAFTGSQVRQVPSRFDRFTGSQDRKARMRLWILIVLAGLAGPPWCAAARPRPRARDRYRQADGDCRPRRRRGARQARATGHRSDRRRLRGQRGRRAPGDRRAHAVSLDGASARRRAAQAAAAAGGAAAPKRRRAGAASRSSPSCSIG